MYLLDVNVLIALAWDNHEHHARAHGWFGKLAATSFATCNVTQSGFVRLSMNPNVVHEQITVADAFKTRKFYETCESQVLRRRPSAVRIAGMAKGNKL